MSIEKTIICLSTIDWSYAKQRHQLIMEYFAGRGIRIVFVEHLGFARQKVKDIGNILARLARVFAGKRCHAVAETLSKNLTVVTPLVLPPSNRVFDLINNYIFLPLLARRLLTFCDGQPLVWTYLATSTAVNLIKQLNSSRVVYDCVYDALRHPAAPPHIADTEQQLLVMADIVITDADYFLQAKRKVHPRVYQVMPGVDFVHFHTPDDRRKPDILDVDRLPRPRVSFFGCIGKEQNRIDVPLLEHVARRLPGWSVVFIGPVVDMKIPDNLTALPNLHWLGFKSYEALPYYLAQCDVIMFPYLLNDFTESLMPAKLFESLATGKPVVSTALSELRPWGDVISIAADHDEFVSHIEAALREDTPARREQRIAIARDNTWERRFARISEILGPADPEGPHNKR